MILKNKYYEELPIGKIVLAELGNKAGIIGAAMIAKHGNKVKIDLDLKYKPLRI